MQVEHLPCFQPYRDAICVCPSGNQTGTFLVSFQIDNCSYTVVWSQSIDLKKKHTKKTHPQVFCINNSSWIIRQQYTEKQALLVTYPGTRLPFSPYLRILGGHVDTELHKCTCLHCGSNALTDCISRSRAKLCAVWALSTSSRRFSVIKWQIFLHCKLGVGLAVRTPAVISQRSFTRRESQTPFIWVGGAPHTHLLGKPQWPVSIFGYIWGHLLNAFVWATCICMTKQSVGYRSHFPLEERHDVLFPVTLKCFFQLSVTQELT